MSHMYIVAYVTSQDVHVRHLAKEFQYYEGWNFNSGNYLFTTDTK